MALKSIETEWKGFSEMVFKNINPSSNQTEEMKKAFFAGAWVILCAMREIGKPHISEDAGVAYMEARHQEGLAFFKKLMKDYAELN